MKYDFDMKVFDFIMFVALAIILLIVYGVIN